MTVTIHNVPMTREALSRGRPLGPPRCIVLHATAGSAPGDYEWLRKGGAVDNPVSTHYYIAPDGRITQFVSDNDRAWHAGASTWLIDGTQRSALNDWSIGIELSHSNRADQPHTPAQYEAAVALTRQLALQYTIPRSQVIRHRDCSPGRKTDPAALPWPQFVDDIFNMQPSTQYSAASPIVGDALGTFDAALRYLRPRASRNAAEIVELYQAVGSIVDVDWFLALAQACHETGNWTSALSRPFNRDGVALNNPAGIGVTGAWSPQPANGYVWDADRQQYRACVTFWTLELAVRAHIGRMLLYAVPDNERTDNQQILAEEAERWRPVPPSIVGTAPTIGDFGGNWAPSATYGHRVAELAERMRRA
jgi:hypothetical protein